MFKQFRDRTDAGQKLAARLTRYANRPDVLVLALPRGGVPVAFQIARTLKAPLDVFLVRKLGLPGLEELAFGALASGGTLVLNQDIVEELEIGQSEIDSVVGRAQKELARRERAFRGGRPALQVKGRTVILVDDGVATGATMRAAVRALRAKSPARIIIAIPTAPGSTCRELQSEVDEVVCLMRPDYFNAISVWYQEFAQTTDAEVRELLANAPGKQELNVGEFVAV